MKINIQLGLGTISMFILTIITFKHPEVVGSIVPYVVMVLTLVGIILLATDTSEEEKKHKF
jgi:hypothetical protein